MIKKQETIDTDEIKDVDDNNTDDEGDKNPVAASERYC